MSHSSAPKGLLELSLQIGDRKILRSGNNAVNADCQPQPVDFRSLSAAGVLRMDVVQRCCGELTESRF